ncbi:hypothetical protein [Acinetobacter bereziniae]|uniref:hypothetical protein n=1 Tax=Acinetobacter bereziniae TaxID=106648 RepID=UPI0021E49A5A|nr:hypothetical protein [Acinetobacter bereziniae]MCV2444928.1 hypothetical protein [Acinetobacter bereziniae]
MDWLREKLWQLDAFKKAFPKVFWWLYLLGFLVMGSAVFYFPFLNAIANIDFGLMGKPFFSIISTHIEVLKWGVFVVPLIVLLLGLNFADKIYQERLDQLRRF